METNGKTSQINSINNINRLIHEPARLAILTVLSSAKEVDFNFLVTTLGLTKGNLASHIDKLATAGYIEVKKEFVGKLPHTTYRITSSGDEEFQRYWENIKNLAPE